MLANVSESGVNMQPKHLTFATTRFAICLRNECAAAKRPSPLEGDQHVAGPQRRGGAGPAAAVNLEAAALVGRQFTPYAAVHPR